MAQADSACSVRKGSGKTLSMLFFSQKVLRTVPGNWTFVIVTDRTDLDDQAYRSFADAGVLTEGRVPSHGGQNLQQLLSEDHRYVFTLIQKFRADQGPDVSGTLGSFQTSSSSPMRRTGPSTTPLR